MLMYPSLTYTVYIGTSMHTSFVYLFVCLITSGALEDSVGLKLVGPYHLLAGRLTEVSWSKCVLHCRFFYDPPEFLTVLKEDNSSGFHIGYFRFVNM